MPSTWTGNLALEKPATGEQAGVWGSIVNLSYDFIDEGVDGNVQVALNATAFDLMTNQGVLSLGRNKVVVFAGSPGGNAAVHILPTSARKLYFFSNHTIGGFDVTISQGTGAGGTYTIKNGHSAIVFANGGGDGAKVVGFTADLQADNFLVTTSLVAKGTVSFDGVLSSSQAATFSGGVTISPSLTLNLGSDATGDLYYRGSGGSLTRLGIGASGNVLVSTPAGPAWQAPAAGIGIGVPVAGATNGLVLYTNASNLLAQDANFGWTPTTGLGIGMAALSALTIGRGFEARITLDTNTSPPDYRSIVFSTGGKTRWRVGANSETETGTANVGSNFAIQGYNDAATGFQNNFVAFRNGHSVFGIAGDNYSALVTVQNGATAQEGLTVVGVAGQTAKLQSWRQVNGTTVASIDNAGNLVLAGTVTSAGGGSGPAGLALNAQNQLVINPAMASPPPPAFQYATLHLGPDASGFPGPSIGLENAGNSPVNFPQSKNYTRLFVRNHNLVIQYDVGGTIRYVYLPLAAGSVTWVETQPSRMTIIHDTVYYADGSLANGRLVVEWKPFVVAGVSVVGGMMETEIVAGILDLKVVANAGASPLGSYYTAKYELENGAVFDEYWIVNSVPQVTLGQIRIGFPPTPSAMINPLQLTSAGAKPHMFLAWNGTMWVPSYATNANFATTIGVVISATPASDLSAIGSPVELGGTVTINVPDAGPTSRGVVTTLDQSFFGVKTFSPLLKVTGNIDITGSYFRGGLPLLLPLTPWISTIDAQGHVLDNCGAIGIGHPSVQISAGVHILSTAANGPTFGVMHVHQDPWTFAGIHLRNDLDSTVVLRMNGSTRADEIGADIGILEVFNTNNGLALAFGPQYVGSSTERVRFLPDGRVGIGLKSPVYLLDVAGDVNTTGQYRINGIPIGQTPWLSDIDANSHALSNCVGIGIGWTAQNPAVGLAVRSGATDSGSSGATIAVYGYSRDKYGAMSIVLRNDVNVSFTSQVISSGNTGGFANYARFVLDGVQALTFEIGPKDRYVEQMRITQAGYIGMGTKNPSQYLTIAGTRATAYSATDADTWADILSENWTTAARAATGIGFSITSGAQIGTKTVVAGIAAVRNSTVVDADTSLVFITRPPGLLPVERMWITAAGLVGIGRVPTTYQVEVAGDVNLVGGAYRINGVPIGSGGVVSVFGRTGAVIAQAGDYVVAQVTGAVPDTRNVIAGTGLTGGGDLTADRTLAVTPDTTVQRIRYSYNAGLVGTRPEVNLIPGANVTLAVVDDVVNNRINVTVAAAGGSSGGMVDPTTTLGDLIVRGSAAPVRLGVGANTQVLVADSAAPVGIKWASLGAASQTPWAQDIDAFGFNLGKVGGIGIGPSQTASAGFGVFVSSNAIFDGLKQTNGSPGAWAGVSLQNDTGRTLSLRVYGSTRTPSNIAMLESSNDFAFGTGAVERMRILATGRVGIGLVNPAFALDVVGDINASGAFRINGTALAFGVSSVFSRTGAVVAAAGDYTAAQVTNAVSVLGAYADPAWITSLAWAKITGTPAPAVASVFSRTGAVVAAAGDYTAAQVTNAVSTIGAYADPAWITSLAWAKVTGVPAGVGQSPWVGPINGNGQALNNAGSIGIGIISQSPTWKLFIAGGALGTTVGSVVGAQSSQVATVNDDRLSFSSARIAAGSSWDTAAWRISRTVDVSDICTIELAPQQINMSTGGVTRFALSGNGLGLGVNPTANLDISDIVASDTPGTSHKIRHSWGSAAIFGWRIGAGNATLVLDALGPSWYPSISVYRYAGWVGIGHGAPFAALSVIGSATGPSLTHRGYAAASFAVAGMTDLAITHNSMAPYPISLQTRSDTTDGASYPLALNPLGGPVGIGIESPGFLLSLGGAVTARKLAVYDAGGDFFGFGVAGLTFRYDAGAGSDHVFYTSNNTERMRITAAGQLTVGTVNLIRARATIAGVGPVGANVITSGNLDNALELGDLGGAAGNGGLLVFSAASQTWRFAAIRGLVTNGSGASQGDLAFSIRKNANDATLTEAMKIRSDGWVSLGAPASTTSILHINQPAAAAVGPIITLENSNGQLHDAVSINFLDGGTIRSQLRFSVDNSPYGGDLVFFSDGAGAQTERFRITSAGNVGIGINPIMPLDVNGNTYGAPAVSGSAPDGTARFRSAGHGETLDVGITASGVWLQSRASSNYAVPYNLLLNPAGGAVVVGFAAPQATCLSITPKANSATVGAANLLTLGEASAAGGYYLSLGYFLDGGTIWKGHIQAFGNSVGTPLVINGLGGAVAIGKIVPGFALDVGGEVNATGFRINGTPIVQGGGVTTQTANLAGATRVFDTTYTNSSGKPMFVMVNANVSGGSSGQTGGVAAYSGAGTPVMVGQNLIMASGGTAAIGTGSASLGFWVLPGNSYKVIAGGSGTGTIATVNLSFWVEWY